jgi:hypothetical protein
MGELIDENVGFHFVLPNLQMFPKIQLFTPYSHLFTPYSHLFTPYSLLLTPISHLPSPIYFIEFPKNIGINLVTKA